VSVTNSPVIATPRLASKWLAKSYFQQSQFDLRGALESARAAAKKSTNFGFAWERIAKLEFSFGHNDFAVEALDKALHFSPRNAQDLGAQRIPGRGKKSIEGSDELFPTAIDLDGALSNGWLGRGLVRIRLGDKQGGRADLQTAAAMEPNRSLLRSCLAKGFDNLGR
jgi:tetratricopeptide (TPR) repeat protein